MYGEGRRVTVLLARGEHSVCAVLPSVFMLWLVYTPHVPQLAASQVGREARAHPTHSLLYVLIFELEISAQK